MLLSDIPESIGLRVVRDARFESLGKATHDKHFLLTFLEADTHLGSLAANPHVAAVITRSELSTAIPSRLGVAVAGDPRCAFYRLHDYLRAATTFYGPYFLSEIHPTACVHPAAYVAPRRVRIGPRTTVEARAVVLEGTDTGVDSVIRAGATVGAEGFEFSKHDGKVLGVPHAGGLVLGDRVEIQSNSVVEKAPYGGVTSIGADTKIGGSVLIAHNCQIGCRCLIAGGVTISGNVTIEDDVWIGPGSVISNGLRIGKGAHITIGAVVARSIAPAQKVSGNFAVDHATFLRAMGSLAARHTRMHPGAS